MKNLLSKSCYILLAACFCFALTLSSVTQASAKDHLKTEKFLLKAVQPVQSVSLFNVLMYAETPAPIELPAIYAVTVWPVPVSDAKPDNTNYQLIRQDQLKIHVADANISC